MHLDKLSLHHFRNLHGLEYAPSPGINLVSGANGHGKSNLLESLHFLCLAHSARARRDKDMIAWGDLPEPGFVIRGEGFVGESRHVQSLEYRESGCRVKIGSVESRRIGDLLGYFLVVAFTPEDLDLLRGGPQERRRFLDLLLCQRDPTTLEILRRYRQALRQRNAALRLRLGPEEISLISAYDEILADAGAEIIWRRLKLLEDLRPIASNFHAVIGGQNEKLSLEMTKASAEGETLKKIRENLLQKLQEKRMQDCENQLTSVGPHRDDLLAFIDAKMVRDFASQGQKRTVALALKLASARLLEEASGLPPILLMDDVFAELDPGRRERFGALIQHQGQAFIATPRREDLPFAVESEITMRNGKVG